VPVVLPSPVPVVLPSPVPVVLPSPVPVVLTCVLILQQKDLMATIF
jgi:hypothetical protein